MAWLPDKMTASKCFLLQKVRKMKVEMFYIVVALISMSVASSHATDCSPPIKNVTCVCSNISLTCHGIQEDHLDIVELVKNISVSFPLEQNFSADITIENVILNPSSSFTNLTISSLRLSSGLSHLPDSLFSGVIDCLHVLNLKSNNFDRVPSSALMTLKQLHTLDLSHNNISILSKNDFQGLDDLRSLNLEYNIISVIETQAFSSLPLLQVLDLDHNALVFLNSSVFEGLLKLNQLSFSGNALDSLESNSIIMLPSLTMLHADKNNLTDLENIQLDSVKLRELSVRECAMHGPLKMDSLKNLPGLISADFSYNNITEVQSFALSASFQLKHLNLSYNNIKALRKDAFSALFNLITLDLRCNEMLVVPESAFYNLTKLKYLNLNNNNLQAFLCPYTVDLISLESIHLENNQIKVIRSGAFIYSQNLTELKLDGNELNCSCYIYDFSTYLLNRTSYWKEDISMIKCHSPHSVHGESVINVDFSSMKCRSEVPCESRIFADVFDDDDEEEEENNSTMITLGINDTSFAASEIFENFSTTVDSLSGYSTVSDNGTSFYVPLTSSTVHVSVVTENSTGLPPNNTTVQSNDSTAVESTVSPFSSTVIYDNPIDIKNFSLIGKKLCIEWSVNQKIHGNVFRCLLSYPPGYMKPVLRKYIKCPSLRTGTSDECVNIKATVISELCIQLINSSNKAFAKHCVSDNETLSSSADNMNTTSSINLGSSAITVSDSTTFDVTNATDNIFPQGENSTLSSTISSGSVSSYTVLDPISTKSSLLTQTSSPELTSEITNQTSEQMITESTETSSSITRLVSTTKALYVSNVNETYTLNETDFTTSANTSQDEFSSPSPYPLSTGSGTSDYSGSTTVEAIFSPDAKNFSSPSLSTTVVQSNGSSVSGHTVSPLSPTAEYNYPIDVKHFSVINKKLCIEWSINQGILNNVWHCLLSYTLGNRKPSHWSDIRCPTLSNGTSEECLDIKAIAISELCIQLINSSNKVFAEHCAHEHYIDHPPTSSVSDEQEAFNITHLSVRGAGDSAIVKWTVNREEPLDRCSLKLNIESNSSVTEEQDFGCTFNSYTINSTEDNVVYEICLTSYHSVYDSVVICRDYHIAKATSPEAHVVCRDCHVTKDTPPEAAAVKSAQYYSYAVLIGLLVLVICFLALLLVRAIFQKRSSSDAYNVFRAERNISIRKESEHQTVNQNSTSRYSYTASEAV